MFVIGLIGFVEAVVFLLRYRSAHSPSHWWSAFTTSLICVTRFAFVAAGAGVVVDGGGAAELVASCAVYTVSATLTTAGLHKALEQRKARGAG